jgi:hypothetical protein
MSTGDKLQIIFWLLFFVFIFYYAIFQAPANDKIYSSDSEGDVTNMQRYLKANGIDTYIKSKSPYRLRSYGGLANPSLHVLDPKERDRALNLIQAKPIE